ncbi:hypothetical protein AWENTII_011884 [Aspergillus wentii]|nr:hypothetical protein MW887_008364 [Aspergillus wentii]
MTRLDALLRPHDSNILQNHSTSLSTYIKNNPTPLSPVIEEFKDLIESDSNLFQLCCATFEEVPTKYRHDPLGHPQIRHYTHFLQLLNHVIQNAPRWDPSEYDAGYVGFPILAALNWAMATPAGRALFIHDGFNQQLKKVLNAWAQLLANEDSTNVLTTDPSGWLSPTALQAMEDVANCDGHKRSFTELFVCDPSQSHFGFTCWDEFFTRRFREDVRPVASPGSDDVIVNACESETYQIADKVALRDRFWVKHQPYSLVDLLAHDPLTDHFVGGTIYQAYLSTVSYHRWHSPVSGTVVRATIVPGTYYAKAPYEGYGDGHSALVSSQAYLCEVATRGLLFIQADNPDIGLVCVVFVGMAEVSTCDFQVHVGQHVSKGDEIGMFHFGGSSYSLLFGPEVQLEWADRVKKGGDGNSPVRSELAVVR